MLCGLLVVKNTSIIIYKLLESLSLKHFEEYSNYNLFSLLEATMCTLVSGMYN